MSRLMVGLLCGLIFGAVDVALMLPMSFPDKRTAFLAAFFSRFGIGFVIPLITLAWPGWVIGLVIGVLLSLPDAVITKAYGPILLSGAIGGLIIGGITHGWAMR
jgi:Na+/glutamate symporter